MRILEQVIQEETFDIEVQYCDPDECLHDCIHSGTNNCDAIITGWRQKEAIMKEMEKVVQEETFEIEVQYCDPDDCLHDCIHSGTNNCDAIITGWRQELLWRN